MRSPRIHYLYVSEHTCSIYLEYPIHFFRITPKSFPHLLKLARPLDWRRQNRSIRNVTTFSKLNNLPLPLHFLGHCKRRIGKVDIALYARLESTGPPNHVHEAALVAIGVGNAECVDETVLEGRESDA